MAEALHWLLLVKNGLEMSHCSCSCCLPRPTPTTAIYLPWRWRHSNVRHASCIRREQQQHQSLGWVRDRAGAGRRVLRRQRQDQRVGPGAEARPDQLVGHVALQREQPDHVGFHGIPRAVQRHRPPFLRVMDGRWLQRDGLHGHGLPGLRRLHAAGQLLPRVDGVTEVRLPRQPDRVHRHHTPGGWELVPHRGRVGGERDGRALPRLALHGPGGPRHGGRLGRQRAVVDGRWAADGERAGAGRGGRRRGVRGQHRGVRLQGELRRPGGRERDVADGRRGLLQYQRLRGRQGRRRVLLLWWP